MFKVRPFENKTLSWWETQRDQLDLTPSYQRKGGLWSEKDKAFLVDSILNEYDIPKIYVADFTLVNSELNEKNMAYAVIDGKQRFEAIFDFFDGRVTLDRDFRYLPDKSLKLANLGYKDLRSNYPKVASNFENFNLAVMTVITDENDKINELFVRLNRNKPLTGAEIRNAMLGPIPLLLRTIAGHIFFKKCIRFATKRGQDLNVAAKLLLLESKAKLVSTKKINLDALVEEGQRWDDKIRANLTKKVLSNLERMEKIFNPLDELLKTEGPLSVYYWLVREFGEYHLDKIRPFLVGFHGYMKNNAFDHDAINYAIFNRSTNDQASLEGRYEILKRRFEAQLSPS